MKSKGIVPIILVIFFSTLIAYFIANMVIKIPQLDEEIVTVEKIQPNFEELDQRFFNDKSVNIYVPRDL